MHKISYVNHNVKNKTQWISWIEYNSYNAMLCVEYINFKTCSNAENKKTERLSIYFDVFIAMHIMQCIEYCIVK